MHPIEVSHVTKEFYIGDTGLATERLMSMAKRVLMPWKTRKQMFQALADVDFVVPRGATFGIVGRNGSGKTTLLKLLARVTQPTAGSITVRGRVGPLIEVGAGFHPELTGAENIFVNGAILDMKRHEIKRRYDDIVAFSELEKFLATPLKQYSWGMYVRLGFAVAAYSNPEVILVDEVLSVGDANFQRKSLARVQELSRAGTTVLFVSHNLIQVEQLCGTTLVLNRGKTAYLGETRQALDEYRKVLAAELRPARDGIVVGQNDLIKSVRLIGPDGREARFHRSGDGVTVAVDLAPVAGLEPHTFRVGLYTVDGLLCHETERRDVPVGEGDSVGSGLTLHYPFLNLAEGEYRVSVSAFLERNIAQPPPYQVVAPLVITGKQKHRGLLELESEWGSIPTG